MNSIIPALFSKLKRVPFFFEVNDDPYCKQFQEGSKSIYLIRSIISHIQDKINLKLCKKAFVINHSVIKKITSYNPRLDSQKLTILPSGANTELFRPMDRQKSRTVLNLNADSRIIGFAGTLFEHQGVNILIRSATKIINRTPEIKFVIIGEGPKKLEWTELTKQLKVHRQFIFTGQIPYTEMPVWLNAMDICLAPFLNSAGFRSPVKIFDYMACGKAVIASKIPGTTDIFEGTNAIILVEPENPDALADSILELLRDKNKAAAMGKEGRRLMISRYDRENLCSKIVFEASLCLKS